MLVPGHVFVAIYIYIYILYMSKCQTVCTLIVFLFEGNKCKYPRDAKLRFGHTGVLPIGAQRGP